MAQIRITEQQFVDEDQLPNTALRDAAWVAHDRNDTVMACALVSYQGDDGTAYEPLSVVVLWTKSDGDVIGVGIGNDTPDWQRFPDIDANDSPAFRPAIAATVYGLLDSRNSPYAIPTQEERTR